MPIADLHQDLLSHVEACNALGDEVQTSTELLERSSIGLVVASTFKVHAGAQSLSRRNARYSLELMGRYRELASKEGWRQILAPDDLLQEPTDLGLVVHVEGMGAPDGAVEQELSDWWLRGCRSVGPMWNLRNGIGGGPGDRDEPLTAVGRRAVRWIDRAPMMLDLAHMGEATFWDTLAETDGVLVCSHANARALCEDPRNLSDRQIEAIADRDGIVGLVLSRAFLGLTRDLEALLRHAEHIVSLVGIDHLAIGTDFGGIADPVAAVPTVEHVDALGTALEARFGAAGREAIAWSNAVRALRASLDQPRSTIRG